MLKNSKQQIKLTIHQIKIVSSMLQSFFLKMSVNESIQFTDKLIENVFDHKKVFNSLQRVLSSIFLTQI